MWRSFRHCCSLASSNASTGRTGTSPSPPSSRNSARYSASMPREQALRCRRFARRSRQVSPPVSSPRCGGTAEGDAAAFPGSCQIDLAKQLFRRRFVISLVLPLSCPMLLGARAGLNQFWYSMAPVCRSTLSRCTSELSTVTMSAVTVPSSALMSPTFSRLLSRRSSCAPR